MRHHAKAVPFSSLHSALEAHVASGVVGKKTDGPLAIYTYTDRCTFEKCWDEVSLVARGLVLDEEARRVAATPFPKFFNFGENGTLPPNEPFVVTEKLDGSLGIIFFHNGRWRCATKGSFYSAQAKWAEAALENRHHALVEGWTYLAEIIYPENRIVVPYDYSSLVLLSVFDEDGYEIGDIDEVPWPYRKVGRREFGSVDEILDVAKSLPPNEEGFVVRFKGGLRLKIKGDEYCRIHRAVSNCTPLAVWELLMVDGSTETTRLLLPEEFQRDMDDIERRLTMKFTTVLGETAGAVEACADMTDKEIGLAGLNKGPGRWVFSARKHNFFDEVLKPGSKTRRAVFETFRPTGNRLDGYTPGSAMNRFTAEAG